MHPCSFCCPDSVFALRHFGGFDRVAEVGGRIAAVGVLDPACIGKAVQDGDTDPTMLKKVRHCLARHGDASAKPR